MAVAAYEVSVILEPVLLNNVSIKLVPEKPGVVQSTTVPAGQTVNVY